MKKVLFCTLFVVALGISYLIYNEFSFSPLKQNDFKKLFNGYEGKISKSCSKDFLGLSLHGELFEIYLYNIKDAKIEKDFPEMVEWEGKQITKETIIGKWKNCPLDTQTIKLYNFTLTANNFDNLKYFKTFNKELQNTKNYYSYIYFDELEQYFLLYCTDKQSLYYIRRRF